MRVARNAGFVAILTVNCSGPAPPPVQLSTSDQAANTAPIVAFYERTCLAAGSDNDAFPAALAASGWRTQQTQTLGQRGSDSMTPNVWRLDHSQLLQASLLPGQFDCILTLDAAVAPPMADLRTAMRDTAQRAGFAQLSASPNDISWASPMGPAGRRVLSIRPIPPSREARPGPDRPALQIGFTDDPAQTSTSGRE